MIVARRGAALLLAGPVMLAVAGCGGATSTGPTGGKATPQPSSTPTPSTLSVKEAASAYVADIGPTDTALPAFKTQMAAWNSSTTDAQAEADAQPLITAINILETKLETKLETTNWPSSAKADVETMTTDLGQFNASLEGLSTFNFLDDGTWVQGFTSANNALIVAVGEVHHDLGLPPAS